MISAVQLSAATVGVLSHLLYFHRGEHHMHGTTYLQAFLFVFASSVAGLKYYESHGIQDAIRLTSVIAGYYLAGLYSSLLVYRLFFNPLNKFPGPAGAGISKFVTTFQHAKKLDCHLLRMGQHKKYGKYLRVGPNDLSVTDPDAVQIVMGPNSRCTKSEWYDNDKPFTSMHTSRSRAMHDRRRRVWAPAFSDKALRGYERRVQQFNDILVEKISDSTGKPMNMSDWFNLYSFDVMGDLAFGKSYDMLQVGEKHWSLKLLDEGMDPIGLQLPSWFFRILIGIPGAATGFLKFIHYCCDQVDERMKVKETENPDIMSFLLAHYEKSPDPKAELPMLQADSRLIIVAGSDTTAATLVHLFYHLASDPSVQKKLREELKPLFPAGSVIAPHQAIIDAKYLNGCINETLRLHPPVPTGVFRLTPPEGIQVGTTFVPGNTKINIPSYSLARDPEIYKECESFVPERWFSKSDMILHKDAFVPFSIGPWGCIGKNLALMELRLLISQLVMQFDVSLAPGEDGSKLLNESTDHFTVGLGELKLVFNKV